jgi:cell division protein FtsW (lipid II flippase)
MLRVADRSLFISTCLLIFIGLFMIASTTYFAELKAGRDAIFYLKRQIGAMLLGFLFMGLAAFFDYRHLKALAPFLFALMVALLVAGHFFGVAAQGAQRWLNLGPFSFQPSEIAKLIMIITMNTLNMIHLQTHIPVRRVRSLEQMVSGIILMAEGTFLSPLSSTKQKPANHVLFGLNVQGQKPED